jgi:putative PIN family toxin of toxin-antitoxin system
MRIVIDTSTLIAAVRSPRGASAEILRRVLRAELNTVCSVPLFFEYEAVMLRPEHLAAAGIEAGQAINLLDALAGRVTPVDIRYLWRPRLRDPGDDMVLEAAVNGQAAVIVTFNVKDFLPQIHSFGIAVKSPSDFLKGL